MNIQELTKTLIGIESISGNEYQMTRFLKDYLEKADFSVTLQEVARGRCNLFAFMDDPVLVLSTHQDTVAQYVPVSEDEINIYGRGACDAKGIMAAQIKAAEKLAREGVKQVGLLFVVGEESGSDGARLANTLPNRSRFLINGEPTENRLASGSKGAYRLELITRGQTAHSAYPELGESAIIKLLDVLNRLRQLDYPRHDLFGDTTLNIGVLEGGIQANVVPDYARAELIYRTVEQTDALRQMVRDAAGQTAEIKETFVSDPVALKTVTGFETIVVSYATDIPLLNHWGEPLLMGPGSIHDAHTPHERITKAELTDAVDLYAQLIRTLL